MRLTSLHTENRIEVKAPPSIVFDIASNVSDWPRILPHYRSIRVLETYSDDPPQRRLVMKASRTGIPVRWTSLQELDPLRQTVFYHHLAGVTKGMDVVWRLHAIREGTLVTIVHDLPSPPWWLRTGMARYLVGKVFIENIAGKTLRGVKRQAESHWAGTCRR